MPRKKKKPNEKPRIPLPEALSGEPKIEMLGNREIIIDGCKGVVEYGENLIKLNTGEYVLSVLGDALVIKSFDGSVAVISGKIAEITFVS